MYYEIYKDAIVMARIFTDGFELGDTAGYNISNPNVSSMGYVQLSNLQARGGDWAMRLYGGSSPSGYVARSFTPLSEFWSRAAFYFSEPADDSVNQCFLAIRDTLSITTIRFLRNPITGALNVYRGGTLIGSSPVTMPLSTWIVLEFHVIASKTNTGVFQVKFDGSSTLAIDFQGITLDATAGTAFNSIQYGHQYGSWPGTGFIYRPHFFFDDIALDDEDWCGPGTVIFLPANENGDILNWARSNIELDHYLHINERPSDGDGTYLYTGVEDRVSKFGVENMLATLQDKIINNVWVEARGRKEDAETSVGVKFGLDVESAEFYSDNLDLPVSYDNARVIGPSYSQNPSTNMDWNPMDLENIKIMIKASSPEVI